MRQLRNLAVNVAMNLAGLTARVVRRVSVRGVIKLSVCAVVAVMSLLGIAGAVVADAADGHVITDLDDVPPRSVVLVPGARIRPDGETGLNVRNRLEAAAALVDDGTAGHVLVSGDNRQSHYNEPVAMRNWLVDSAGLAPADVTLDYAGLDTWDTCRRANEQFGVADAIVVTQHRYADRTAALCRAAGIDAVVLTVDSPPQSKPTRLRLTVRERLAAVKAWSDMVRQPRAQHSGPFIGLVGSEGMPAEGHPPDWDWTRNTAVVAASEDETTANGSAGD